MRKCATVNLTNPMLDRKRLGNAFKALSDPTRLRMLRLLATNRAELCVCEFVDTLQERQYNVSKHLKVLEQSELIEGEKDGRWVYYKLAGANDPVAGALHRLVISVPDSDGVFSVDQRRFEDRMSLREDGRCRVGIQTKELAE